MRESLHTRRLGTFYSRSRKSRWCKGETSGHFLQVTGVYKDCDSDSIIYLCDPIGPACHTGARLVYCSNMMHPSTLSTVPVRRLMFDGPDSMCTMCGRACAEPTCVCVYVCVCPTGRVGSLRCLYPQTAVCQQRASTHTRHTYPRQHCTHWSRRYRTDARLCNMHNQVRGSLSPAQLHHTRLPQP